MSESFDVKFNFPGPVVIQKKILKDSSHIKTVKTVSPLWHHESAGGQDFNRLDFVLCHEAFM
jgi:hypothetical protein